MKFLIVLVLLSGIQLASQDMKSCPMHTQHMKDAQHQADLEKHGDEAMGFPHDATTHHFQMSQDGGAIEITVNDSKDVKNIQAIRSHLTHIATMFANGDFSIPMFVHSALPPGVVEMKEKQAAISYRFMELPNGGEVTIKTQDHDALNAVHDFLRFQIEDHATGDQIGTL